MENFPLHYDCAYKYLSSTGETKFCLPEINIDKSLKSIQVTENEFKYSVFSLIPEPNGFRRNGIDDFPNLKKLPCLCLSIIETEKIYLTKEQMDNAKPILLINIENFLNGNIIYREGMNDIYGIEMVR